MTSSSFGESVSAYDSANVFRAFLLCCFLGKFKIFSLNLGIR